MEIYLTSIATNLCELENKVYKNFENALDNIYINLNKLVTEVLNDCDFFNRDYVQKYFSEEFFKNFVSVNCKSEFGFFTIGRVSDNKYQFVFSTSLQVPKNSPLHDYFIVCELDILELLD